LYDFKFNKISELIFKEDKWPAVEHIEEIDEHFKVDIEVIYMYTELCFRHINGRLSNSAKHEKDPEFSLNAYENYVDIFELIIDGNLLMGLS
jgi:hypothetical protein